MPYHLTPVSALSSASSSSSSSSSRPPSVLNLRCREEMLVESPPPQTDITRSTVDIGNKAPAATVAATTLLSSPTDTSCGTVADDSAAADDIVVVVAQPTPPSRYYQPFGQNANDLSLERNRLHRISLQAHQHQQQQHFLNGIGGERRHYYYQQSAAQLEEEERAEADGRDNSSVLQQQHQQGPISLTTAEMPKGTAKVLASIDTNIPTNGARLSSSATTAVQLAQQRAYDTPISRNNSSRLVLRPSPVFNDNNNTANNSNNSTLQQQHANRKRRAAEEEEDRRLNDKERPWVCADVDRAVHLDGRPLQAMLQAEKSVTVSEAQIRQEQRVHCGVTGAEETGIEEWARTKAVEWMQEVCVADNADYVVFPLAVAYLDRILAYLFVPRRNLQALASACLLLASKMRAPQPMSAQRMAEHTDNSVRMDELLDWEILVLNHLQWNLLQSTPFEFFDQLLVRSPVLEALREDFAMTLHRTQKVLRLATQLPSVQAAATLLFVAVRTRKKHLLGESEQAIRRNLGIDPMTTLVPLFGSIETAVNGSSSANGDEAQRQYAQSVEEHWQLGAIQPPSSKRMSLGTLSGNVPPSQSLCCARLSFLLH